MTHELHKREDRFTIQRRLKYTCGWTSEELAWQAESDRRMWLKEHNPARILGDWIDKHTKGEFSVQTMREEKFEEYVEAVCKPTDLTLNIDGFLHDGDIIRLKWTGAAKPIYLSALPLDVDIKGHFLVPTRATGSEDSRVMVRNTFQVCRNDQRVPSSVPLMYDECIYMCSVISTGKLLLHSEMKTYNKFAVLSGNQEVCWAACFSSRALWKVQCKEERTMKGCKKLYIPVNTNVVLNHVVTNQNLALEKDHKISTILGTEYEISANNYAAKPNSEPEYAWTNNHNPSRSPTSIAVDYKNTSQFPTWTFEAPFHIY